MSYATARTRTANGEINKLYAEDRIAHEWYRFVLSFPPHLVRDYLQRFGVTELHQVLDPFCGTGTTLVECKRLGIPSVGLEANPMASFASRVKTTWSGDADGLVEHADTVADEALAILRKSGIEDDHILRLRIAEPYRGELRALPEEQMKLLLTDSISPLPLHKTLVLLDCLRRRPHSRYADHEKLALAKALVQTISNLHFGPEVGVGPPKGDAPVVQPWLDCVYKMADDLRRLEGSAACPAVVHAADAREPGEVLGPESIDAVITSPPYPNEKDYTRTTRLESVLLGFVETKGDLQALKRGLVRSNTRGVYKVDTDDEWIASHPEVLEIAEAIEARRLQLGKTSGFERMYHRVTKLYFGGMARHLANLRYVLKPGAQLAYVVGDQASYLRIMIRTGDLLGRIAESLGYEVVGVDLFRTRLATATREQLREEVLLLRWPGAKAMPKFSERTGG
jgi:DNA modification methylase